MKTRKYVKLCFWNDTTPFDGTSAGLMLVLECRVPGGPGCAQENNVCQGTAASPTFKASTVDPSSAIDPDTFTCDSDFWCLRGGVDFGATTTTTLMGVPIEGRGSDHVSINRFWTGTPLVAGAQGTAAILETTFDSAARVNDLRSGAGAGATRTLAAISGSVEMTNYDLCVNASGNLVNPGVGCVNFQNRIRTTYTFGGAVRIQE